MQERDEERERLRRELQRSQDQIHAFLSTSQSQVSGGLIPRPDDDATSEAGTSFEF